MKNLDGTFTECPNEPEMPWFQVPRSFIRNPDLSLQAKGFMTYLMSHSETFKISIPWIIKTQKISKNKIYTIINECMKEGYLLRETYSEHGMKRYRYLISRTGRFKKCLPCPENEDTEKRDTEKGDSKLEQSSSKEEDKRERGKPSSPPLFTFQSVKMAQEKYDKLVQDFGLDNVTQIISDLSDYSEIKPKAFKQYGCHAAVVRKWIKEAQKIKPSSPKGSSSVSNKKKAKSLAHKIKKLNIACQVEATEKGITFSEGSFYLLIEYSDIDFEVKLMERLMKMNLRINLNDPNLGESNEK